MYVFLCITLPVVRIEFTVVILKFGIEDFTDPGLLKIRLTSLVCRFDILFLHKCFFQLARPRRKERRKVLETRFRSG